MKKIKFTIIFIIIFPILLLAGCNETAEIPLEIDDALENILLNNAEVLTTHLIQYSIPGRMILDKQPIGETEIWRFLMCTFVMDNSPYHSFNEYTENGDVQYDLSDIQIIAYEVFGIENWFYNPDNNYNEATQKFSINPAQGLFQNNFISEFHTEIIDNVYVKTEGVFSTYISHNGEPQLSEIGIYQCTYKIINENNNYFLRLESYGLEDINKVLVSQKEDEDIFLYAYDEFDDKYERFLLKVDGNEVEFISLYSKIESWLPVIYTNDLMGDNENEIVVIVTTGSGTGVHTEDIFIYNHDLSIQYKILPVLDVIRDIITVTSDDDSYTISSKYLEEDYIINKTALGELQDRFVEEPYFNTVYRYHIIDNCIYAEIGIGIGFLEYYDENIIIKYKFKNVQFIFDSLYIGVI